MQFIGACSLSLLERRGRSPRTKVVSVKFSPTGCIQVPAAHVLSVRYCPRSVQEQVACRLRSELSRATWSKCEAYALGISCAPASQHMSVCWSAMRDCVDAFLVRSFSWWHSEGDVTAMQQIFLAVVVHEELGRTETICQCWLKA